LNTKEIIDSIYVSLDDDKVETAVRNCLRLARAAGDHFYAGVFLRQLCHDRDEFLAAYYDDIHHLKEEDQKSLVDLAGKRWLKTRSLSFSLGTDAEGNDLNFITASAGSLDHEILCVEQGLADLVLPSGMDPYDIAAFTDRFNAEKEQFRLKMRAFTAIQTRLKTLCGNYTNQLERQLDFQQQSQRFLDRVQNDVNNFFKARSDDVYVKLQKAAELAASRDLEDASLLLTEVRRAFKATADFFYPSIAGKVTCADGKERELGEDRYLNRLQEFLARRLPGSTSKHLLQAELDYLGKFLSRLNEMASKGVHASVTLAEAKQGLVGLYFFLFNVCQHLSQKP
jgi:hypothetical protein